MSDRMLMSLSLPFRFRRCAWIPLCGLSVALSGCGELLVAGMNKTGYLDRREAKKNTEKEAKKAKEAAGVAAADAEAQQYWDAMPDTALYDAGGNYLDKIKEIQLPDIRPVPKKAYWREIRISDEDDAPVGAAPDHSAALAARDADGQAARRADAADLSQEQARKYQSAKESGASSSQLAVLGNQQKSEQREHAAAAEHSAELSSYYARSRAAASEAYTEKQREARDLENVARGDKKRFGLWKQNVDYFDGELRAAEEGRVSIPRAVLVVQKLMDFYREGVPAFKSKRQSTPKEWSALCQLFRALDERCQALEKKRRAEGRWPPTRYEMIFAAGLPSSLASQLEQSGTPIGQEAIARYWGGSISGPQRAEIENYLLTLYSKVIDATLKYEPRAEVAKSQGIVPKRLGDRKTNTAAALATRSSLLNRQ